MSVDSAIPRTQEHGIASVAATQSPQQKTEPNGRETAGGSSSSSSAIPEKAGSMGPPAAGTSPSRSNHGVWRSRSRACVGYWYRVADAITYIAREKVVLDACGLLVMGLADESAAPNAARTSNRPGTEYTGGGSSIRIPLPSDILSALNAHQAGANARRAVWTLCSQERFGGMTLFAFSSFPGAAGELECKRGGQREFRVRKGGGLQHLGCAGGPIPVVLGTKALELQVDLAPRDPAASFVQVNVTGNLVFPDHAETNFRSKTTTSRQSASRGSGDSEAFNNENHAATTSSNILRGGGRQLAPGSTKEELQNAPVEVVGPPGGIGTGYTYTQKPQPEAGGGTDSTNGQLYPGTSNLSTADSLVTTGAQELQRQQHRAAQPPQKRQLAFFCATMSRRSQHRDMERRKEAVKRAAIVPLNESYQQVFAPEEGVSLPTLSPQDSGEFECLGDVKQLPEWRLYDLSLAKMLGETGLRQKSFHTAQQFVGFANAVFVLGDMPLTATGYIKKFSGPAEVGGSAEQMVARCFQYPGDRSQSHDYVPAILCKTDTLVLTYKQGTAYAVGIFEIPG